jgi:predicted permease
LYSAGVIGTLALGLSSAAVVLSVTWHVWLAPMPYPNPDGVVRLFELEPIPAGSAAATRQQWRLSPPLVEDLRAHDWETVRQVAGVSSNVMDWEQEGSTLRLTSAVVSPEAFEILGIRPLLGRVLSYDGDAPEVVLTAPFWERAFGAGPEIVNGGIMTIGGVEYSVVGVVRLPAGYPAGADIVTRMAFAPTQLETGMRGARYLDVIARIDPAFGPDEVSAEFTRILTGLGADHPSHADWAGEAVVLGEDLVRPYRQVFTLLVAAGALFLLLSVANVAGLVAARTVDARQDRAVRLALGASEGRLARSSLVDGLVLGVVAAGAALGCSYVLIGPIRGLVPVDIPRVENVGLSPGVCAGVVGLAMLCGIVVGLVSYALPHAASPTVSRASVGNTPRTAGRGLLVAGQVALTVLLGTTGGTILRHVAGLRATDLGFEPDGVVSSQVMLTGPRYPDATTRLAFWRELLAAFDARGVNAAIGTSPPMAGVNMPWGYRPDPTEDQRFAQYHIVSPAYFQVMGIGIVEGRAFTLDDRDDGEPVIIVNEALARANFGSVSAAVGRSILLLQNPKRIVGVVRSVRHTGPGDDAPEEIYAPFEQDAWPHAQVLVRGEPAVVGPLVAEIADRLDTALGMEPIAPYDRFIVDWFAALRLQSIIVVVLAAVGTALATLGLYALVAYRVTSRRREIGVRMALGASGSRMFTDVVRHGALLAAGGLLLGLAAWYAARPFTTSLLGGLAVTDWWVPLTVSLMVAAVSLGASAFPARRSVAVDPAAALRSE